MYGTAEKQSYQDPAPCLPELGRLKQASERIAKTVGRLDAFLYRFNGPRGGESASTAPQPPESYRNDLETLFEQVNMLEMTVAELDRIG